MAAKTQSSSSPAEGRRAWPADDWWRLVTAGAAALALGLGLLAALRLLAWPLGLLVIGVALGAAFSPLVGWLERWLPRTLAIILIYVVLGLLLGGIGLIIVPALVAQAQAVADRLPELFSRAQAWLDTWGTPNGTSLMDALSSQLSQLGSTLLSVPLGLAGATFNILLVLFISIYSLIEAPRIRKFVLSLFPDEQRGRVDEVLHSMLQAMGGYIRGTALNGVIIGVLTYIGLGIIGLEYALVLGLLAGILEVIPVVGPIIAAVPMLAVALLDSPTRALVVLVFVTVLQQAESNLLLPHIMRSQTDVSPLLVILALVAGSTVGGLLGALVAIPLAAALHVFVRQVAAPFVRARTGAAEARQTEGG